MELADLVLKLTSEDREPGALALSAPGRSLHLPVLGEKTWYRDVPAAIADALLKAGASGVVRYEGLVDGLHTYTVYCRSPSGALAVLHLAFSGKSEVVLELAAACLVG